MPTIFATADLAALVAAFPPPSPTRGHSSLVRGSSDHRFYNSDNVLARFRALLQTSPSRIRLHDLPSRLDIASTDWLLDAQGQSLCYSKDSQSLVPDPERQAIFDSLHGVLNEGAVDITAFASEKDIALLSIRAQINELLTSGSLQDHRDGASSCSGPVGKNHYIYTPVWRDKIQARIRSTVADGAERISLSQSIVDVPLDLLQSFAVSALDDQGKIKTENDEVIFEPEGLLVAQESKQQSTLQEQLVVLSQQLQAEQYCRVGDTTHGVTLEALRAFREHGTIEVELINTGEGDGIAMSHSTVNSHIQQLVASAKQRTTCRWHSRKEAEGIVSTQSAVLDSLEQESESFLDHALLSSDKYRQELETTVKTAVENLEREEKASFDHQVTDALLVPVQLYAAGIAIASDETLRQHLEDFLGDHFRLDVVPAMFVVMRDQRLLLDKSRLREMEKMRQACAEAKTLSDIHSAVMRCVKKLKIPAPSAEVRSQLKQQTLERNVKLMQKMPRGSDVLQNLIWVLLAQKSEGLFMSPGKDTTRMIRLYQTVGDAESGKQIEQWRDMLKAGKESKSDLQAMRDVAARAVADWNHDHGAAEAEFSGLG